MHIPVLVVGDGGTVIENKERSLLDNLKQGVDKKDAKLANQATPEHSDGNKYLEDVGREPQKMPQE